ncbi:MAG: hypothetical protein ACM3KH_00230 [Thiobacillus sp.]
MVERDMLCEGVRFGASEQEMAIAEELRATDGGDELFRKVQSMIRLKALELGNGFYPGQDDELSGIVGGMVEYYRGNYGAFNAESIKGMADGCFYLFAVTAEHYHQSTLIAEFAMALARRGQWDAARSFVNPDSAVVQEHQDQILLTLAEQWARYQCSDNVARSMALKDMEYAFVLGNGINDRNRSAFEKVFQAFVDRGLDV